MFLTIGERLNATRKGVAAAIKEKNEDFIKEEIAMQVDGGAVMIDVNAGINPKVEKESMEWLAALVAGACDTPLCLDSPNPEVVQTAVETVISTRGQSVPENFELEENVPWMMINSVTNEDKTYEGIAPLVKKYNCAVVALCMESGDAPGGADERIRIGRELVERLTGDGIQPERIYVDPLVLPVGVDTSNGIAAAEIIRTLKTEFKGLRSSCGLSNVSYGLPVRSALNRVFLTLMVSAGLDSAILDTSDRKLMTVLRASLAMCGRDEYCTGYISAFRAKQLES